jgi:hypothetical protein
MMPEKNPQQPLRNEAQEFRRFASDAETGALKAPAALNEVEEQNAPPRKHSSRRRSAA